MPAITVTRRQALAGSAAALGGILMAPPLVRAQARPVNREEDGAPFLGAERVC